MRVGSLVALAAALSLGAPAPLLAAPGGVPGPLGGVVPGVGLPGVPGVHGGGNGAGGGGSSPGGPIGNGLAGGVGGPSGGLGQSNGNGHGGGGGAISPLSPNAGGVGFGHGQGLGPGGDGLGLGRGEAPGEAVGGLKRRGRNGVEAASDAVHGAKDGDLVHAAKAKADQVANKAGEAEDESEAAVATLTDLRRKQAHALIEAHPETVEPDELGQPVVRGEILALAPTPAAVARAERAGFRIGVREELPGLGVQTFVLRAPRGVSAVEALRRLRALDPKGRYDFNHLYQESGVVGRRVAARPVKPATPASSAPAPGARIGLVDGGVAAGQPTLAGVHLVQKGFAAGGLAPSPHATAVASLLAGRQGAFRGAAPGATLLVADVYGRTPAGGSAEAIARALGWLAQAGAPVINISLVGPPNLLLEATVKALIARGHVVVAAVGNDGPAAAPLYPASYAGVVAVTGVDARNRLLPEASRGTHVDFAAPGSEMAAAGVDGGFVAVRGTSFAAPLAAGLLARQIAVPDRASAERAIAAVSRQAVDLGPRGPDPLFGHGLVGVDLRTPPPQVGARVALNGP